MLGQQESVAVINLCQAALSGDIRTVFHESVKFLHAATPLEHAAIYERYGEEDILKLQYHFPNEVSLAEGVSLLANPQLRSLLNENVRQTVELNGARWFAYPLTEKTECMGVLLLSTEQMKVLEQSEENVVLAVCGMLSAAILQSRTRLALQKTSVELERKNADLQQFAYAAAHDLQEPLRSVVSYLEIISERYEKQLDEKGQRYVHIAVEAGKRMQQLILDLLEFSRLATTVRTRKPTDLNTALRQAQSNLNATIKESGADIQSDKLPTLKVDAAKMVQLFQNLLSNAIKFRKPDQVPQIKVSVAQETDHWLFSIKDNGIGLDMSYADRIFVIFQRLHTRDKYEGTGIGLALCKRIVEQHNGRIWVESKPEEGTTVFFTLER